MVSLSAIGISDGLFLGKSSTSFNCALKCKTSDFVVREIDLVTGLPVDITTMEIPSPPVPEPASEPASEPAAVDESTAQAPTEASCTDTSKEPVDGWRAELLRLVGNSEAILQQLAALDACGRGVLVQDPPSSQSLPQQQHLQPVCISAPADKVQRKPLYIAVKALYPFVQTEWRKHDAAATSAGDHDDISSGGNLTANNEGGGFIVCTADLALAPLRSLLPAMEMEKLQRFVHAGPPVNDIIQASAGMFTTYHSTVYLHISY